METIDTYKNTSRGGDHMLGMVMEVHDNTLIVLSNEGEFVQIQPNHSKVSIGDQISYQASDIIGSKMKTFNKLGSLVASLFIACFIGLTSYAYTQPFGYVNIDINPSAVISYNWFQNVLNIHALNPDGEKLVSSIDNSDGYSINEIVDEIINLSVEKGYIAKDLTNIIYISVSDRYSEKRSLDILQSLDTSLSLPLSTDEVLVHGDTGSFNAFRKTNQSPTKKLIEDSLLNNHDNQTIYKSSNPIENIIKKELKKTSEPPVEIKNETKNTDKNIQNSAPTKDNENPPKDNNGGNSSDSTPKSNNGNEKKDPPLLEEKPSIPETDVKPPVNSNTNIQESTDTNPNLNESNEKTNVNQNEAKEKSDDKEIKENSNKNMDKNKKK